MVRVQDHVAVPWLFLILLLAVGVLPGCGIVPRSRMEESRKLSQLLRAENAQLKDKILSLQSQNRDYADRAVNDLRRLTAREQAIERLEKSVQGYQGDRERLAAAYEQLRVSLGQRPGADGKHEVGPTPHHGSESWEPEHPDPKGITSLDHAETSQ